jgi:hypothetical protein
MKEVFKVDSETTFGVVRDESDRTYTQFVKKDVTRLYDRNKRIRLEGLMQRHQKVPAFGDEIAYSFSMPSNWKLVLKMQSPEVLDLLLSRNPEDNLKGAQRLSILQPNWVVIEGNW